MENSKSDISKIQRIAVLGSTGSIGRQTLDVCREYPTLLHPVVLVAGHKAKELAAQAAEFHPDLAIIADESKLPELRQLLDGTGVKCAAGPQAVIDAMTLPEVDTVVTATVGYSGLAPTLAAIEAGKDIALANKETLVVAGELVTRKLESSRSRVIPVDSEHSAIYQCLQGEDTSRVRRLIITASGGPFRTWSKHQIAAATLSDALKHPNWHMGAKITIDSATMVNKAFEIIEARWLFNMPSDKITAVVHPQSIIHSMVEYVDGSVKAQLGLPDMRGPIRYALAGATRRPTQAPGLSIADMANLTFEAPDTDRFPALNLAYIALERGGLTPCVINAANEVAVDAFLKEKIKFTDIYPLIVKAVDTLVPDLKAPDYNDYAECNDYTRARVSELIASSAVKYFLTELQQWNHSS